MKKSHGSTILQSPKYRGKESALTKETWISNAAKSPVRAKSSMKTSMSMTSVGFNYASTDAQTYEKMLYDQLTEIMEMLLRSNTNKTSHDVKILEPHLRERAMDSVDEGLALITTKLKIMQGDSPNHRITAYVQLLSHLMRDLESALFNEDKQRLHAARSEHASAKETSTRAQEQLTLKIARSEQRIASLEAANATLDSRNQTLARTVDLLHVELEKASSALGEAQQRGVELRMQGWDYKGEVDRRCNRVLASVQTRMGFVPAGIHKQVAALQILKPPGDPAYDRSRCAAIRGARGKAARRKSSGHSAPTESTAARRVAGSDAGALSSLDLGHSTSALQLAVGSGRSDQEDQRAPTSGRSPFSKESFHRFLQQQAEAMQSGGRGGSDDAHNHYLAQMEFLPAAPAPIASHGRSFIPGLATATAARLMESRRLSTTSSASGVTDRRSSTSSAGAAGVATHTSASSALVIAENGDDGDYDNYNNNGDEGGESDDDDDDGGDAGDFEDADSATHASHQALSSNLRKPWSFDNLLQLDRGGEDFSASGLGQHPRVTTTLAAVPVSASSDMLDDWGRGPSGGETPPPDRKTYRAVRPSSSAEGGVGGPSGASSPYDEFVDLLDEEEEMEEQGQGKQENEAGRDGGNGNNANNRSRVPVADRPDVTVHQQLTLRDSAGAMALRKAGTVSPKVAQRKRAGMKTAGRVSY